MFAIAATLLVLDVTVNGSPLSAELLRIWPSYAAYAVTFVSIGIAWINHSTVLSLIDATDRAFLLLNILLLTVVAFVPFPTRLVAAHILDDDARAAMLLYGITITVGAFILSGIWFYARGRGRLLKPAADQHLLEGISRSYFAGPLIYVGATLLAFVSPQLSAALFVAVALFYLLERSLVARR